MKDSRGTEGRPNDGLGGPTEGLTAAGLATLFRYAGAVVALERAITSDSWASSFQTMGQYRAALLRIAREALAYDPEEPPVW